MSIVYLDTRPDFSFSAGTLGARLTIGSATQFFLNLQDSDVDGQIIFA